MKQGMLIDFFFFKKPSLLPRPLSNALERPRTLPPPVPPPKPQHPEVFSTTADQEHIESPEKLSLKARLKLFEKEIEQQGAAPTKSGEIQISIQINKGLLWPSGQRHLTGN